MSIENRLDELGIVLPDVRSPSHSYVHTRQSHNLLFVAGQTPKKYGGYLILGKLGENVTLEQAQECARQCILNGLAVVRHHLGSLDRVSGVLRLVGYVACAPTFTRQPQVINAASDLIVNI